MIITLLKALSKNNSLPFCIRPLAELAAGDAVPGTSGAQRGSVHEVLDRASTGATQQCAPAVDLPMRFIVGPTGVGKSSLATLLAKQLGGEIVGADAFQIYERLPLLTAQPSLKERCGIPHHLIGIIAPTEQCDAFRYRTMALAAIEKIVSRKKIPFIVGGTGLYVRALVAPFDPLPSVDASLRAELEKSSLPELLLRLHELDPAASQLLDIKNPRRVARAIEIITQTQRPLAATWQRQQHPSSHNARGLFLTRDRPELFERIEKNVQQMFACGVVEEIAALASLPLSTTSSMTLGLREIQQLLRGEQTLSTTIASITQATKRYAKRQLTWFQHQHSFPTLNLSRFSSPAAALEEACRLLCS